MSRQDELNLYIRQLHQRLRLGVSLRGATILAATALLSTLLIVLLLNAFAFPVRGLVGARLLLMLAVACAALFAVALPWLRLTRRRATATAEAAYPEFQERLLTFEDKVSRGNDPFIELLAADTLSVARDAQPKHLLPDSRIYMLAGVGAACVAVLLWLVTAGPGFVGYGAGLLWTGQKPVPLYDLRVTPGDVAVRRHGDQLITAQVTGLKPAKVQLFARYQNAEKAAKPAEWEPVTMQPRADTAAQADAGHYQFLFAGLPEDVDYYVQAGPLKSAKFKVRVVDLPSVKQVKVTYHYPKWTGMAQVSEEHGGDLRAIEGTQAELTVEMDRPLRDGQLTLDDGNEIQLSGGHGNVYIGSILMQKDGGYHVAALDQGQPVRLSEDYFIATDKATPPQIAIDRPTGDYRASPIEEVTVGVKASDDFGLTKVSLHYSVNGGAEKTIELPQKPGAKNVEGATTLRLEDFKLVPGDLVSLYATAKDGHAEARTDIAFIQAEPFEREFSQSQQMGGGGGGGKGAGDQSDISKREKELITATWKRQNDKGAAAAGEGGKFLSEVQTKLQEQALALAARMESRDLSSANEEFSSFGQDMQAAAAAMTPSAEKLKQMQWRDAIPQEQKALQYLLRAEATFRKIQVAFGQQSGGGGGGSGAGRDLASLFDLELDTEKNQYETAQSGSAAEQKAKAVDDALQKLDALARRQESLAQQQSKRAQTMEERWQQEMLRREAEQLQRQMEQMAQSGQQGQQGQSQKGKQGQASGSSSSGSSASQQTGSQQAGAQQAGSQQSQPSQGQTGEGADPRVTQALNRLRQAGEEMKRGAGQQPSSESAKKAADQLRQAASLMGNAQQQQATGKLDSLARESERLNKEEHAQADRVRGLTAPGGDGGAEQAAGKLQQRKKLAEDRQQMSDDLSQLEKNLRNAARSFAPTQPETSSKLRDALSGMDQSDLTNRVQRTADWLRRGVNPNSNGTEEGIGKGLQELSQQVHEAQQGLGAGKPGQGQAKGQQQTAALAQVEKLRSQLNSLAGPGAGGKKAGDAQSKSGDVGKREAGGGGPGPAWNNLNTGNNHFSSSGGAVMPGNAGQPADSQATIQQGLAELHKLAQGDPTAQKEVQDLARAMRKLDPRRFPGNPALVAQLQTEALNQLDKLELQLRRDGDPLASGQVRMTKAVQIPPGYEEAVADYYRRLSKGQ